MSYLPKKTLMAKVLRLNRNFYELSRDPILWRSLEIDIHWPKHRFISALNPRLKSLTLNKMQYRLNRGFCDYYVDLAVQRCPHLEELILNWSDLFQICGFPKLKSLKIIGGRVIGFVNQAIVQFKTLETLHLYVMETSYQK